MQLLNCCVMVSFIAKRHVAWFYRTRHPDRAIPQRRVLPLIGRHLPEEEASSTPAAKPDKATAPASAKAVALPGVHCLQHEKSMELMNVAVVVAVVLVAADVRAPHGAQPLLSLSPRGVVVLANEGDAMRLVDAVLGAVPGDAHRVVALSSDT